MYGNAPTLTDHSNSTLGFVSYAFVGNKEFSPHRLNYSPQYKGISGYNRN